MSAQGYERLISAIEKFRQNEIDFHELRAWVVPYGSGLQEQFGYDGNDFYQTLDNWFEYIEFCYLKDDWRRLALSICDFLENVINNQISPISLPKEDIVVKEQGLK